MSTGRHAVGGRGSAWSPADTPARHRWACRTRAGSRPAGPIGMSTAGHAAGGRGSAWSPADTPPAGADRHEHRRTRRQQAGIGMVTGRHTGASPVDMPNAGGLTPGGADRHEHRRTLHRRRGSAWSPADTPARHRWTCRTRAGSRPAGPIGMSTAGHAAAGDDRHEHRRTRRRRAGIGMVTGRHAGASPVDMPNAGGLTPGGADRHEHRRTRRRPGSAWGTGRHAAGRPGSAWSPADTPARHRWTCRARRARARPGPIGMSTGLTLRPTGARLPVAPQGVVAGRPSHRRGSPTSATRRRRARSRRRSRRASAPCPAP